MAPATTDQHPEAEEADAPSRPPADPVNPRPPARRRGLVAGVVATLVVAGLCAAVMTSWSAGASGDVLLGIAALGLLLCLPHTIPVWAGLTLLVATAAALIAGAQPLAESFADLAYYGLVLGCLWGIWNEVATRFSWRMPARIGLDRLVAWRQRRSKTEMAPAPLAPAGEVSGAGD